MTDNLSNYVHFDDELLTGNVATLSFDIDFIGGAVASDNTDAPKYRLRARSPRGKAIEIGGIWQRLNRAGKPYLTPTIYTGHGRWYANLGRYAGQDDANLQAVTANDWLNRERGA